MQGSRVLPGLDLTGTVPAREESNRARAWGGIIIRLAGPSIVLACLALPWILWRLAISTEEADKEAYIEALGPSDPVPSLAAHVARARPGTSMLDQQYYFVNGCVSAPRDCASPTPGHWGEYYLELGRLYAAAVAQSASSAPAQSFEQWATGHTHFIISQIAPAGAIGLGRALQENKASGDIHIVGTSAGGAAVFTYLSQAMRGDAPLDRRIRSVLTVDSPLGYHLPLEPYNLISAVQASAMKTDVQPGIGEWAKAAGITILTIDTREDMVGYDAVPGVTNDPAPVYPQSSAPPAPDYVRCASAPCQVRYTSQFLSLGSTWHIYTGSHMSNSAREFIDRHWR